MAALNFPNSPSTNDLHTENGVTFKWNGTIWKKVGPAYTDTTNLNVTGISTFGGVVDINGNTSFGANGSITTGANFSLTGNALTVTGTSTVVGEFKKAGSPTIQCTDTTNSTDLQLRADATGGLVRTASNKPLLFGTNQTERLRITSDGQLLHSANKSTGYTARFNQAHADNPAEIEINSPNDNNLRPASIQLMNNGTDKWGIGQVYASTSSGAFHLCAGSTSQSNSKFTITTAGLVGIGTINPSTSLHAYGGGTGFRLEREGSNPGYYQIAISHGTPSGANNYGSAYFTLSQTTADYVWKSSSNERMRLLGDSGNLGLGHDNPNWPLTVQRSSGTTTIGCKNTGGNASVYIEASNTNTAKLELAEAGTGSYSLRVGNDNALMFFDDSAEKMRLNSSGRLMMGPDAQDIQLIPHSTNSGHGQIYFRGNASNESSSVLLNHFGHANWFISSGRAGNGVFSIGTDDASSDADSAKLHIETGGKIRSRYGIQSGGNATGGYEIASYADGYTIRSQRKSSGNGGANDNPLFEGWYGSNNAFRVNCDGGLRINGANYIESADFRYSGNGIVTGRDLQLTTRYNTNTSLISAANTGTGSGTRITFNKAVYVLCCVSQDVNGSNDTGYWSMQLMRSGSEEGRHLIRQTTHWDMFTFQQGISVPANGYLHFRFKDASGWGSADTTAWSHYTLLVWQNV